MGMGSNSTWFVRGMLWRVLVVTRYRVAERAAEEFRSRAHRALDVLGAWPGYLRGYVGRNVDDRQLWTVTMHWRDVGSYRRALSGHDVKMTVVPLLSQALDEPSAYELDSDT